MKVLIFIVLVAACALAFIALPMVATGQIQIPHH